MGINCDLSLLIPARLTRINVYQALINIAIELFSTRSTDVSQRFYAITRSCVFLELQIFGEC